MSKPTASNALSATLALATVIGATHTLTRRVNDMWLTAVGDVPPAALDQFMRALQRKD